MGQLEILRRDPPNPHPTPLLFVHGAWHGAWCWNDHFLDWFAERGFQVIAPSLRGHGGSGPASRTHRLRHYAEDVRQVAADLDSPPVLIGHSMGAYVVQHALRQPGVGAAGILVCPPPPGGVLGTALSVARRHPFRFLWTNLVWRLGPLVDAPHLAKELFLRDDAPEEVVVNLHHRLHDESYLAFLDMLFLDRPRAREVTVPIRVIGGSRDRVFPVASVQRVARAYGGTAIILEDAAHDLMIDEAWPTAAQQSERWIHELVPVDVQG
ncbi:MAG: alpha/beta hydrolase [Myxococcota bacterium]